MIQLYDSMLKPVCSRYGLVPIEATIISFLFNHPGRDTAADLVELRMLSKSNVSQAVESLIQKSLLQRRQDTADRRRIHLLLTAEAAPITAEIEKVRASFHKRSSGAYGGGTAAVHRFNERIAENTNAQKEKSPYERRQRLSREEPVGKLLLKLALPTVTAQIINMLYNIVDRIYIGHIPEIGEAALTGVGVCMPLIMIVTAFSAFAAYGGAPRASIYMGQGDHDSAEKTLGNCFAVQFIIRCC